MKPSLLVDDLLRPVRRVAMPRAPRLAAPGGTVPVVARGKNRECCVTNGEDCAVRLTHLREMRRPDAVTLLAPSDDPQADARAQLDEPARHRQPGLRGPACPPPGAAKNWNHARAESRGLRVNSVRYPFLFEGRRLSLLRTRLVRWP